MEDMGGYFRKWKEWRNIDLSSKSSTFIKGVEKDEENDNQSTIQPTNQQLNQLNVKLFQQILVFQQAFKKFKLSTNSSFSTSFQQSHQFSTLFPCFSQVSGKFLAMLFHSLIVKSSFFFSNFIILIASFIQVYQVFKHNTVFTVNPMFTSTILAI